jgi:serine carboxypeptidase-like clade 1
VCCCSGDHDMMIPYVGTQVWVDNLHLPVVDDWRPWFVDGQIAGLVSNILIHFNTS